VSEATAAPGVVWKPFLGVAIAPALTGAAVVAAPHVHTGEGVAAALTFGGGAAGAIVSLAVAAPAVLSPRLAAGIALSAVIVLLEIEVVDASSPFAAVAVTACLVGLASAVGGAIGRRIQHPGHLLPACVVAAAVDIFSVLDASGPTHAIVRSERALSVLTVGFPVAGTSVVAPVLGVGDLLLLALIFGAVSVHRLSVARAALLGAAGVAVAGGMSAAISALKGEGVGVPALPPIAVALLAGMPAARRLRREDRRTALVAMAVAGALAGWTVLKAYLASR
jgi:hypothetical protein